MNRFTMTTNHKSKMSNIFHRTLVLLVNAVWVLGLLGCQAPVNSSTPSVATEPSITPTTGVTIQPEFTVPPEITVRPATPTLETPPASEPFLEPTPEMIGEMWIEEGVPPERDPRINWYYRLSVEELWEQLATQENQGVAVIVLKRPDLNRGYFDGQVLISEDEINDIQLDLLEIADVLPWTESPSQAEMPIMPDGQRYPAVVMQILSEEALANVRRLPTVEAVEPLFPSINSASGIGCSLPTYQLSPGDSMLLGDLIPWTYKHLGVLDAWNLYKMKDAIANPSLPGPGYGIRIGIVDTGILQDEHQLTTYFRAIGDRSAVHNLTVVPKAWDDCGHGNRLAGLAAAPLDVQDPHPKILGVAWGADLTSVKYNSGVIALNFTAAETDLAKAIETAVNDRAQVVNLALGMPFGSVLVYDTIVRLHKQNTTIFVAAAGTFVWNVTFPGTMPQVLTAAAVKSRNNQNPQTGYDLYTSIPPESAYGPEVDFAAIMGDGAIPTTGGSKLDDGSIQAITTVGGSSSATAHISGIIALSWGMDNNATPLTVINRLRDSTSRQLITGSGLSKQVGYGIPDAYLAAGGSRHLSILGPTIVPPGTQYTLTATYDGWLPLDYQWDSGQNTNAVVFTAGSSGTETHSVTATNPLDGSTLTAQFSVVIGASHYRTLYSKPIVRWPPYPFAGGEYDLKVNENMKMPAGCSVVYVTGQLLEKVNGVYQDKGPWRNSFTEMLLGIPVYGYSISRPGGLDPQSLHAKAYIWHDGAHAIRVKVVYRIIEPDGVDCNVPGATVP